MVDVELLARRARRAAEWGRIRVAARVATAVAPLAVLAYAVSRCETAVCATAAALLATAIGLRWWSAEGGRAVKAGLLVGAAPMAAALLTIAVEGPGDPARLVTACGATCLLVGLAAGAAGSWHAMRSHRPDRWRYLAEVGVIASLTTALGCVGLGAGSTLAVLAAVLAGALAAALPAAVRTR
jgi:hypothetical protein